MKKVKVIYAKEDLDKISKWNSIHAIVILIAALLSVWKTNMLFLAATSIASFCYFLVQSRGTLKQLRPYGGYANWVTGCRFILLMVIMISLPYISYLILGVSLLIFVSLDGVDGWLARRYNQSTVFGQYFDMELDALYVMMMCCYYFLFKEVDIWILFPGLLRYLYKIGIDLFPKENFREKKKRYASGIAGVFFTILIVAIFVNNDVRIYGLAIGSLLIVVSFGISTVEYIRFSNS